MILKRNDGKLFFIIISLLILRRKPSLPITSFGPLEGLFVHSFLASDCVAICHRQSNMEDFYAEHNVFGIALSSPGLCSPGFEGEQGWSPCSSVLYEGDDSPFPWSTNNKLHRPMTWPLPPPRMSTTKPLAVSKARSLSVSGQRNLTEQWLLDQDLSSWNQEKRLRSEKLRRVCSAPTADYTSMDEECRVSGLPPIMPQESYVNKEWDDEEKVKMDRLHASFSLLGLRQPCVSNEIPEMSRDDSSDSDHSIETTPTAGLCLLNLALSPEHRAPSLAEQMAFASGLGSQCQWASPHKIAHSSSDGYLPLSFGSPEEVKQATKAQQERRHASRHIRQECAARKASKDDLHAAMESEDVNALIFGDDDPTYALSQTNLQRNQSVRSTGASTIVSSNSSPILHGALSAQTFATLASPSSSSSSSVPTNASDMESVPSTCITSVQSSSDHQRKSYVDTHSSHSYSPPLISDFSYLVDNPDFLNAPVSPKNIVSYQTAGGFNGNTMSPPLNTPELGLLATPAPMQSAPTPMLEDQCRYSPDASLDATHGHDDLEQRGLTSHQPRSGMLPSSSTTSVLHRPRPGGRSRAAYFFGRGEMDFELSKSKSQSEALPKWGSVPARRPHKSTQPDVPPRRASLDALNALTDTKKTTRSPRSRKPAPQADSVQRLPVSASTGTLSAKALAQVQEACRLKGSHEAKKRDESSVKDQLGMPTLFTARTASQRSKGQTGYPATEPQNLALAKLGFNLGFETRFSTVQALHHGKIEKVTQSKSMPSISMQENLGIGLIGSPAMNMNTFEQHDADTSMAMPDGFVLIVEQKTVQSTHSLTMTHV